MIGATTAVNQKWISVKWVNDGDTIVLSDLQHVRYIGINSPEIAHDRHKAEAFGYAAKKYNQSRVQSKKIRLFTASKSECKIRKDVVTDSKGGHVG